MSFTEVWLKSGTPRECPNIIGAIFGPPNTQNKGNLQISRGGKKKKLVALRVVNENVCVQDAPVNKVHECEWEEEEEASWAWQLSFLLPISACELEICTGFSSWIGGSSTTAAERTWEHRVSSVNMSLLSYSVYHEKWRHSRSQQLGMYPTTSCVYVFAARECAIAESLCLFQHLANILGAADGCHAKTYWPWKQ